MSFCYEKGVEVLRVRSRIEKRREMDTKRNTTRGWWTRKRGRGKRFALVEVLALVRAQSKLQAFRGRKVLEKNNTSLNFITSAREKKKKQQQQRARFKMASGKKKKASSRRRRRPKVRLTVPEEKEKKRAAPPRFHNALRPKRTPGVQSNCRGKRATSSTTP